MSDEATQRAVVGYLNTYAGPWGLKASEEDAVLGIIRALWPAWCTDAGDGIRRMRGDHRLDAIADALADDCGETGIVPLVQRIVAMLTPIMPATPNQEDTAMNAAQAHRLSRDLDEAQLVALIRHSKGDCQQCGAEATMYALQTGGFDPTTWLLCAACHPQPDVHSIDLDDGYADFLAEPLAATYTDHLRIQNDPFGVAPEGA